MADSKISDLAALTAPAPTDMLVIVDVSDTSMAASGTDKRIAFSDVVKWTSVEVDFGAVAVFGKTFTITDAAATSSSHIVATASGATATGRQAGDVLWDSITFACVPGTGSFTLHATPTDGAVEGKRIVLYQIS